MVRIRLARHGAKKRPYYRIVVADQRKKRDGRFIEQLGTYDPVAKPPALKVEIERAKEWISKGAQPSERVAQLLRQAGLTGAAQAAEA